MDNKLIFIVLYVFFFDCGITVEGLRNVRKGEYPFMAFVYYPNEKSEWRRFLEAAILITPEWLVSSAVDLEYHSAGSSNKQLTARMGAIMIDAKFSLPQDGDEQERKIYQVVKSLESWWKREINLLRTTIPFQITDAVSPIAITTAKTNLEEKICNVLVYSEYTNDGEEKHLIEFAVTILESDIETCGKNFDQRAMICGQHVKNITSVIDPDFCLDNSGGPLICNGEVIGLQSYVDNNECKPPYFYQMFWAWNEFITCGTNDCEGDCEAICTFRYKDEIVDNNETLIAFHASSEKALNESSLEEFNDVQKNKSLKTKINFQNNIEESAENNIVHKKGNNWHEKEVEILENQTIEQGQKTKEKENTISQEDHIFLNASYYLPKGDSGTTDENEVASKVTQGTTNKTTIENPHISSIKLNDQLEKEIILGPNDNEQNKYSSSSSSEDQSKKVESEPKGYQIIPEKNSSTDENSYTVQHKITSEEDQNTSENDSSPKKDKKNEVTEGEDNNVPESTNNAEENKTELGNGESTSHKELFLSANGEEVSKDKNENTSEDSANKTEHEQDFTEREVTTSKTEIETSKDDNEGIVSEKMKNEHDNEPDSTISEINTSQGEQETSKEENGDNTPVKTKFQSDDKNEITQSEKKVLHNEKQYLEAKNKENSAKETKTKSKNQSDNIENESVVLEHKKELPKVESEHNNQNKVNPKHKSTEEDPSKSQNDKDYKDNNYKEKNISENLNHSKVKEITQSEENTLDSKQDTHSDDHTKEIFSNIPEESKSENKEGNSNHSTEPNEVHSSHIIMEITSVVIKTAEDLLYAHRNNSRQYGPRTTIDLNDTNELVTPKPKFGKMGRAMTDHAGSRTQHTLLHCLFMGTVFDLVFVILF